MTMEQESLNSSSRDLDFGLAYDKEGKGIITALTKGACYDGTVFHLHGVKHGFPETSTSYDGVVGGKL